MLSLNSLLLSSENHTRLVDFYKKVLEKEPDWQDDSYAGFMAGGTFLSIGSHDKVHGNNPNPERMLINFETTDVKGEFERIKQLGAEVIVEPYEMGGGWITTLADPDGNYFQLVTPWKGE